MAVTRFLVGPRTAAGGQETHQPADSGALQLQVLGPLRLLRGGIELDPGPRQQAYLFALLLARGERPIAPGELIDLMWGEDEPASALNVIHKYVGSLRRLLEPGLPLRHSGAYLTRGRSGYRCAVGPDVLDLARFRALVRSARAEPSPRIAFGLFLAALRQWRGAAGEGLLHTPAAVPIFASLNDEYFAACVEAAEVAATLGRSDLVIPALQLAAGVAPFHEPVQASLVLSLGAAGRQAEALATWDAVRRRLADELGIDPGEAMRSAHQQVLDQRPGTAPPVPVPGISNRLIGRSEELSALRRAVGATLTGETSVLLLEGEPGAGKTRLLEQLADDAETRGALVVWGHCSEGAGTPALWPWVEVVTQLLEARPSDDREELLGGDLGRLVRSPAGQDSSCVDGNSRFQLLEELLGVIRQAASDRPLVVVLDDLQWADVSSLEVLDHVIARLPAGAALVGALRNRGPEVGADLARTLAAASRVTTHRRLLVGPLDERDVAGLIASETGGRPPSDVARLVHARTAGNAFFVREVARSLAQHGGLTGDCVLPDAVPLTVRDVVRDRVATLDRDTRSLLEAAALLGRSVELVVLAESASLDVGACMDNLEPIRGLGLIDPVPDDPFTYRFTHDLVRQAVSEAITPVRAGALHRRIADALEKVGRDDASVSERVAGHLWAAGPMSDPARTVATLLRAGDRAQARTALAEAEGHFRHAVELARNASTREPELAALSQLIALVGMRSMYSTVSVELMERAEQVAHLLGRERDAAGFLFSRWTAHVQGLELGRSRALARRLRERGATSKDPVVRMYGEAAWGIQQWQDGNVGESFRCLRAMTAYQLENRDEIADPMLDGLRLLMAGTIAEISAYHGDATPARALLDGIMDSTGEDPYTVTVATSLVARAAAIVGDAPWALAAAERGLAADPQFCYVFLGTYVRLARCWALAMSGSDAAVAADEAELLIVDHLTDPVRSCVSTWYALLAEMRLAYGSHEQAAAALDRADELLERHGQRPAEALVVLIRAELAKSTGDLDGAMRLAAGARELALSRGALAFVHRADDFLASLERSRTLQSSSTARS